jgi:hypothetical protein
MFKKFLGILLVLAMILAFAGCGERKVVHCDSCGAEIEVDADSNVNEDWSLFCSECEEKLGLDEIVELE